MASGRGSAFKKELRCSDELRELTKEKRLTRGGAMKAIWHYIKKHKLQDKKNGRTIRPDKDRKLAVIIGKKPIDMMKMPKLVFSHLTDEDKKKKKK